MFPQPHPLPNGLVIIFEGIDGVGKTTQLQQVQAGLENAGWPVMATRNLGGTPIGEELRNVLMSADLERPALTDFYVSLAIQEPLLEVIDDARAEGKIVLMDRGPLSLAAYQIYGAGIDESLGWQHVGNGMDRIKPDLTILYDMEPSAALERNKQHPEKSSYFERKPIEYFRKVAEGFHKAAERYDMTVIDASLAADEVQTRTMNAIQHLFA